MSKTYRNKLLSFDDRKIKKITVKALDDMEVGIRSMSAGQRSEMLSKSEYNQETGAVNAELMQLYSIIYTVCDPDDGELIFTDEDVDTLREKSMAVIDELSEAAFEHNGLGDDQMKSAEKNSSQSGQDTRKRGRTSK